MSYKDEGFEDFDHEFQTIPGFEDTSWHNDSCPSIAKYIGADSGAIKVYQDYMDSAKREADFLYTVYHEDSEGEQDVVCESNDWEVAKDAAIKAVKEYTPNYAWNEEIPKGWKPNTIDYGVPAIEKGDLAIVKAEDAYIIRHNHGHELRLNMVEGNGIRTLGGGKTLDSALSNAETLAKDIQKQPRHLQAFPNFDKKLQMLPGFKDSSDWKKHVCPTITWKKDADHYVTIEQNYENHKVAIGPELYEGPKFPYRVFSYEKDKGNARPVWSETPAKDWKEAKKLAEQAVKKIKEHQVAR